MDGTNGAHVRLSMQSIPAAEPVPTISAPPTTAGLGPSDDWENNPGCHFVETIE
jgi:hypothetical protein